MIKERCSVVFITNHPTHGKRHAQPQTIDCWFDETTNQLQSGNIQVPVFSDDTVVLGMTISRPAKLGEDGITLVSEGRYIPIEKLKVEQVGGDRQ